MSSFTVLLGLLAALALGSGCSRKQPLPSAHKTAPEAGAPEGWVPEPKAPAAPPGMVWIPQGALVAGTLPERLPRKADQEMPGEQLMLEGFFIDVYSFPNEQGSLPLTNVSRDDARTLCEEQGKRLCSELEWERACKGPNNQVYEYGMRYVPEICGMGMNPRSLPSGYLFGCRSEFGVHDLHGGAWEWTDSPWGRGRGSNLVTLRGGNGVEGEVIGRCANAEPKEPSLKAPHIGFRCCAGPRNNVEVTLELRRGTALRSIPRVDRELATALQARLPTNEAAEMKKLGVFRVSALWEWHPLANEDLLVAGGCAGVPPKRRCGVLVVRRTLGRLDVLGWGSSGQYLPTVKLEHNPRLLWLYGGDKISHFRRPISFEWGKISLGKEQRNVKH